MIPSEIDLYLHVAGLLEQAGDVEAAGVLASRCFVAYTRVDDQLGAYFAAQVASRHAAVGREKISWSERLREIETTTCYKKIRGGAAVAHLDIQEIERLNSILLETRR